MDDPEVAHLRATLAWLDERLTAAPNDGNTHALRAGVLSNLNLLDEAIDAIATAERCGAQSGFFYMMKGVITHETGDLAEAGRYFRRALRIDPTDPVFRYQYGLHLLSRGEFREGLREHEYRLDDPDYCEREGLPSGLRGRSLK